MAALDSPHRFAVTHALLPGALFASLLTLVALTDVDARLAARFFYDAQAARWMGSGSWWANQLVHTGGRDLVRAIAAAALLALGASWLCRWARPWRRGAAYVALSIALSTGIVGALKMTTNVDCPWDLREYGGERPSVGLFAHRPDELPRGRCFPGAHSSSGFALMCFYFLLRDRRPRAAIMALAAAAATGSLFAFAQEARGAHFLSHDLASAAIVWFVLLLLYLLMLRASSA